MSAAAVRPLADELGQQRDLVVLERARAARDGDGAAQAVGRADAERQRERPAGRVRAICSGRPLAVAASAAASSATAQVVGRVLGQRSRGCGAEQAQAAGVGVERLDRAAQHDVDERVDVELGGEGVAHAAHGRLQAAALADGELQAALGLLDALRGDRGPAA